MAICWDEDLRGELREKKAARDRRQGDERNGCTERVYAERRWMLGWQEETLPMMMWIPPDCPGDAREGI